MGDFRTLNRTVLAEVEAVPGVDAAPTVAANAILVENPQTQPGLQSLQTNEVTGSLDPRAPIAGGGGGTHNCTVNLKGSGLGGEAPEWGVLLRGCGYAETLRAADVAGVSPAAGGAAVIVLQGGHGADVQVGEVISLTGGTGNGQTRVITGVNGDDASVYPDFTTPPDITTAYVIHASAHYAPASRGLEVLSIYDYLHSTSGDNSELRRVLAAAGEVSFTFPNAGLVQAVFNYQGKWVEPSNPVYPGPASYDAQRPVMFAGADISLDGQATKFNQLTFGNNNQVQQAPDPSDRFGVDIGGITRRGIAGRVNPPLEQLSVRNVFDDFVAGALHPFWVRYGAPGNAVSVYFPEIAYTGREEEDVTGFAHEGIPFGAQGEDSGVFITVY